MLVAGVRKVAILIVGSLVVLVGIVMIVAPGPAIVVIPAGLAILATEFAWAQRLLHKFREFAGRVWHKATDRFHHKN